MSATLVAPKIWLGSHQPAADYVWLRANKITAIVNVARDHSDPDLGIPTFKVGLVDGPGNRPEFVLAAIDLVTTLIDHNHTMLVHCISGVSRSPYILARALERRSKSSFGEIYAKFRSVRPEVLVQSRLFGNH